MKRDIIGGILNRRMTILDSYKGESKFNSKKKEKLKPIYVYSFKEIRTLTIIQLIYRTIMVLYMVSVLLQFFYSKPDKIKTYVIYLTNQTFIATLIYFLIGIFSCVQTLRF
jgi:hypothetical protein